MTDYVHVLAKCADKLPGEIDEHEEGFICAYQMDNIEDLFEDLYQFFQKHVDRPILWKVYADDPEYAEFIIWHQDRFDDRLAFESRRSSIISFMKTREKILAEMSWTP